MEGRQGGKSSHRKYHIGENSKDMEEQKKKKKHLKEGTKGRERGIYILLRRREGMDERGREQE